MAITATCASVHTYAALIIGFIGSLAALVSNELTLAILPNVNLSKLLGLIMMVRDD